MAELAGSFESTDEERFSLQIAVDHWCVCSPDDPTVACPAHRMLADVTLIKHLLFMRRMAEQILLEEFRQRAK